MLVEVIIVTVVVATIMTSLYVAFNKLYTAYDVKNKYNNIDGIYALKLIKDDLVDNMELNTLINNTSTYSELINPNDSSYIANVFTEYKINKLYLIKTSDISSFKTISDINQTFKDYIDYLVTKEIINNSDYLLVLEITVDTENEIYNYAYLEV